MTTTDFKIGDLVLALHHPISVAKDLYGSYQDQVGQVVGHANGLVRVQFKDGNKWLLQPIELKKLACYGMPKFGSSVIVHSDDFPEYIGEIGTVTAFESNDVAAFPVITMADGTMLCLGTGEYEVVDVVSAGVADPTVSTAYKVGTWVVCYGEVGVIVHVYAFSKEIGVFKVRFRTGEHLVKSPDLTLYASLFTDDKVAAILNTFRLPTMDELHMRDQPPEPERTMSGNFKAGQDEAVMLWNAHVYKTEVRHALDVLVDYLDLPVTPMVQVGAILTMVESRLGELL